MSVIKAGMSRSTARNYLRDDVMEQRQVPRTWGTREDPLEAVWPQALIMLGQAPELEFPAPVCRAAYDHLTRAGTEADRRYLEILKVGDHPSFVHG